MFLLRLPNLTVYTGMIIGKERRRTGRERKERGGKGKIGVEKRRKRRGERKGGVGKRVEGRGEGRRGKGRGRREDRRGKERGGGG